LRFLSTRGAPPVSFTTALFNGLAADGGLFVPETMAMDCCGNRAPALPHLDGNRLVGDAPVRPRWLDPPFSKRSSSKRWIFRFRW
jgi:hypothetical protein